MIRNLRYTIPVIWCMLTLASPTCEDDVSSGNKLPVDREALEIITEDLTAESLTRRNLDVFESRAVEKLWDYEDYLNIQYDRGLDKIFHDQAGESIKDLFANRSVPENPFHVKIDSGSYNSILFLVDSVDIIDPLKKEAAEIYTGSMQFNLEIYGIAGSDTFQLHTHLHQMGMLLQRRLKDFGEDSVLVWEVFLIDFRAHGNQD